MNLLEVEKITKPLAGGLSFQAFGVPKFLKTPGTA